MNRSRQAFYVYLSISKDLGKGNSQSGVKPQSPVHPLVTGGAGDGETGHALFLAPLPGRLDQPPGNALATE